MPFMQNLLKYSQNLLNDSMGVAQVDFTNLNNESQGIIGQAQQGVLGLANGELPTAYTDNMQTVLNNLTNNAVGTALNNAGKSGVINSSVMTKGLNDISKNAANTMAEMYNTNINTANGLFGQMDSMASDKVTAAAAAQEAAQAPAMNLLNASLGGSSNNISAIGALKGTGTYTGSGSSTTTTKSSGGGGFGSALLGGISSFAGGYL